MEIRSLLWNLIFFTKEGELYMKRVNYFVEFFVEKHNGVIQGLLLAIVVIANCIITTRGLSSSNKDDVMYLFEIIITLIIGVILELILLQVKDSSSQRKINGIGEVVRGYAKREDVWREETDLEPFFNATKQEFFVSGIIIDKLIIRYLYRIKELMDRGVKVKILIESPKELEEAAKFLYGQDYTKETSWIVRTRLSNTLIYLQSLDNLENYFSQGLLEIGLSNAPFVNPSIIAYDYTGGSSFEARRTELSTAPEMSVRFYMQGVDGPTSKLKTHPTLLVNSNIMAKQYDDFVKVIGNTWGSSNHITTKNDFDKLKEEVLLQLEDCGVVKENDAG